MPRLRHPPDAVWLFTAPTHTRNRPYNCHFLRKEFGFKSSYYADAPPPTTDPETDTAVRHRRFTLWFTDPTEAIKHFELNPDPFDRDDPRRLKVSDPPLTPRSLSALFRKYDPSAPRSNPDDYPGDDAGPISLLLLPCKIDRGPHAPRTVFLSSLSYRWRRSAYERLQYHTLISLLRDKGFSP